MMRRAGWICVVGVVALVLGGCQDPLFPRDAPRSPYDRYQHLRDQDVDHREAQRWPRGGRPPLRERWRPMEP